MEQLIVIPARLDSARLPQKMILDIAGKSLIQWCYESVMLATSQITSRTWRVVLAVDSYELLEHCMAFTDLSNVRVIDGEISSGTERVAILMAMNDFKAHRGVLVVQGDELYTPSALINLMCLKSDILGYSVQEFPPPVLTAVARQNNRQQLASHVFAFTDDSNEIVSLERGNKLSSLANNFHLGYNMFTREHLEFFLKSGKSTNEIEMGIELRRFIDNSQRVVAVKVPHDERMFSVNTEEDLIIARRMYEK